MPKTSRPAWKGCSTERLTPSRPITPRTPRKKKIRELDQAPFGIIGLETALPLMITRFVKTGILDWPLLIERMATAPARILGMPNKGTLRIGADADVTVIDPEQQWTVTEDSLHSKSKNSPYLGWELVGRPSTVIVGGAIKK